MHTEKEKTSITYSVPRTNNVHMWCIQTPWIEFNVEICFQLSLLDRLKFWLSMMLEQENKYTIYTAETIQCARPWMNSTKPWDM